MKPYWIVPLSFTVLLAGCGTTTTYAAGSTHTSPTLKPVTITNAGATIQAKVPSSWRRNYYNPGAANNVSVGKDVPVGNSVTDSLNLFVYTIRSWHPHNPLESVTSKHQYSLFKRLNTPGHDHDYAVVTVPNTAANRQLAHRIVDTIKLTAK